MFERIVFVAPASPGPLLDGGLIAESLIFYRHVLVVGTTWIIEELLRAIPPQVVLKLMQDKRLEVHHLQQQVAVQSANLLGHPEHGLVAINKVGETTFNEAHRLFLRFAGSTGTSRVGASRFANLVKTFSHQHLNQQVMFEDLAVPTTVDGLAHRLITHLAPEYKSDSPITFRLTGRHDKFTVETNLDFERLNASYHRRVPPAHSSLTPAYIVARLQSLYEELHLAATLDSEIVGDSLSADFCRDQVHRALRRRSDSEDQIEQFSSMTLKDTHAIRHAVNAQIATFSDVLRVLEKADRFRDWLSEQHPDAELVQEFYSRMAEKTWIEGLQAKAMRFTLFTAAGLLIDAMLPSASKALGPTMGAIDSFLVDHLAGGWRPHHFVQQHLRPTFAAPLPVTSRSKRRRGR